MTSIKTLRNKIKLIDTAIIKKLAQRNKIARRIGVLKADLNKNVVDKKREKSLFDYYQKIAPQYQLSPAFIGKLFQMIIMQSRKTQRKARKSK